MNSIDTDVAVIGAGTAGLAAYRAARAAGARAVLIEGGPYGTTCARVGCMPSKLLIAAAEAAHAIDAAPGFGVHIDGARRIDGRAVMARVRNERDRFVGFVLDGVNGIPGEDRLRGHARFLGPDTLDVDGHTQVKARAIVVATGSRPAIPGSLAGLGERLVVNDDVFSWQDLPRSVAVLGPGVIGLELGQALHRLGVRVVVLGRGGRLGPITDPEVRHVAEEVLRQELRIEPGARPGRIERQGDEVLVEWQSADGASHAERFDYLLAATGRVPNVDRLAIDRAGLTLDGRGVPRFDLRTLQAGTSTIFIAGDAANDAPVLHEAADEGRIAGTNAARFPDVQPGLRRAALSVVFSDPQIAVIGGGWQGLRAGSFATGRVSFADQGRSRVMLANKGVLHVYGEKGSGRFLGAEMFGPRAEHIAHLLSWALQNRMTVAKMLEMPFYHPVIEEGLRTALRDLDAQLQARPAVAA
jgi:dihydrolipoamide dehydrogenase